MNKIGKLIATGALITSLAVSAIPTEALAHVNPEDILGDIQYTEMYGDTREGIKEADTSALKAYFSGYDEYGCETVTADEIAKAKEMSDFLNTYNDPTYEYTNCTPGEIIGLDINGMYNDYCASYNNGTIYDFMSRNLTNKPALDAYLNFAGLAVSNRIKEDLANMVYSRIVNEGRIITKYPTIQVRNGQIYAVVESDGYVQVIEINGEAASKLAQICAYLDARTDLIFRNISGQTNEYPQGIAYNGVSGRTLESAYLAMPDSDYKKVIVDAANNAEGMKFYNFFDISVEDPTIWYGLNVNEVELLYGMGYSTDAVNGAILRHAFINPLQVYTK
jgi:hypothetical protein